MDCRPGLENPRIFSFERRHAAKTRVLAAGHRTPLRHAAERCQKTRVQAARSKGAT